MQDALHAECMALNLSILKHETDFVQCASPLPAEALMFERQRLPHAVLIPTASLKPFDEALAARTWERIFPQLVPWGLPLFASEQNEGHLDKRLSGLERLIRKAAKQLHPDFLRYERKPEKIFRQQKGNILQAFLCEEGLWLSASDPRKLTADRPGGRYRMKMDPDAPSRSFLKMEEALARLDTPPVEGEEVVDLGAAPGGWTWAFVKRGCQVTAIDNGPLKLPPGAGGQVQHLHADGMRYQLPAGKAFGLLRYWVGENRARRLVMNIKLPQTHPLPALQPLQAWLSEQSNWTLQIRQLYHDRREVTLFGSRNA